MLSPQNTGFTFYDMVTIIHNSLRRGQTIKDFVPITSPAEQFVKAIVNEAIALRASDLHIEPLGKMARLRYRIDGVLHEYHELFPLDVHKVITSKIKIMAGLDPNEHDIAQDGHIPYKIGEKEINIRLSVMPLLHGEKIVLRLMDAAAQLLPIEKLNFSPQHEKIFRRLIHSPAGLFIVTGPVNSGKTTTLYAALNELKNSAVNIMSLEDPIEIILEGINQVQISDKKDFRFAAGLRAALRQDIDTLMLGEIRDNETAQLAIRAALTGHLLFSTLHASESCGALFRLLEMGVPPYLLASSLVGIMSQRLVRCLCPNCREEYEILPDSPEAEFLGDYYKPGMTFFRSGEKGCDNCGGFGYRGRMAIHEILSISDTMRMAVMRQEPLNSIKKIAVDDGFQSLLQDGLNKALAGQTSLAEVGRAIYGGIYAS